ncbi:MAG TPA: hypothetical protein VGG57_23615 [Stellaceae bacterium]|jgi:hypothetical protein
MPLGVLATLPDTTEPEPRFFEPQLPGAASDDWQEALRQIFATEGGIWQRRMVTGVLLNQRAERQSEWVAPGQELT